MLKFVKHHMESIIGIEIFPIISFLIFFIFFLGLLGYVALLRKQDVETLSGIPLNDSEPENSLS